MCEGSHWGLKGRRENLVEFFGEEEVMGVDEACERLPGLELSRGKRTVVIRDVLTLVFPASDKGRVEEGSGLRIRREFSVHLVMLGELGVRNVGPLEGRRCGT